MDLTKNQREDYNMITSQLSDMIPFFQYPQNGYMELLDSVKYDEFNEEEQLELKQFFNLLKQSDLKELQEIYIASFDMNPATCLDIGWHLYGENYNRGQFLVKVRALMREKGIEETTDLPDHLTHIIAVLSKMGLDEQNEFGKEYIVPALNKITKGFEKSESPYKHLIKFTNDFFENQFLEVSQNGTI